MENVRFGQVRDAFVVYEFWGQLLPMPGHHHKQKPQLSARRDKIQARTHAHIHTHCKWQ